MGDGGRRAAGRLSRAFPGRFESPEQGWIPPALGAAYGLLVGGLIFCLYQLILFQTEGPWLELIGTQVAVIALMSAAVFALKGVRRYREGLGRRAAGWAMADVILVGVAALSAFIAITAAQVAPIISGADVHLTRPVIRSLPRPSGVSLIAERPGPAETESISDEFRANHLEQINPFYESALKRLGWTEDSQSEPGVLRFRREQFVVTVLVISQGQPHGPGEYAVTVDRGTAPTSSPSSSPSASA